MGETDRQTDRCITLTARCGQRTDAIQKT